MEYTLFLFFLNTGLLLGLMHLALVLLRPVLLRLFTAQQRVWVWMTVWIMGYIFNRNRGGVLPVTFQDLLGVRTAGSFFSDAAFLPSAYVGEGTYHVALPGKILVPVELNDALMRVLPVLWGIGAAVLVVRFLWRSRVLTARMRTGRELGFDDPLVEGVKLDGGALRGDTEVWVASGLPTSFVSRRFVGLHTIAIQGELPFETQKLVLLHEQRHIALWHTWWKVIATINLVLFWWNPLVWLGFRYFCRDMELACDDSVMKRLSPEERKRYAEILVELGRGNPLLDAPLSFGECDAAVRVRSLVKWKPRHAAFTALTWAMAVVLCLFFFGGHRQPYPAADLALAFQRDYGSMEQFAVELNDGMADALELYKPHAIPKPEPPDMGIVGVWEAPGETLTQRRVNGFSRETGVTYETTKTPYPSLWVQTVSGWYRVFYGWWGDGSNTFFVVRADGCGEPDVSGAFRVM